MSTALVLFVLVGVLLMFAFGVAVGVYLALWVFAGRHTDQEGERMKRRRTDIAERRMSGWHLRNSAADWHYFDAPPDAPLATRSLCGRWDRPSDHPKPAVYEGKPVHGILRMEPDLGRVCPDCLDKRRGAGEAW